MLHLVVECSIIINCTHPEIWRPYNILKNQYPSSIPSEVQIEIETRCDSAESFARKLSNAIGAKNEKDINAAKELLCRFIQRQIELRAPHNLSSLIETLNRKGLNEMIPEDLLKSLKAAANNK